MLHSIQQYQIWQKGSFNSGFPRADALSEIKSALGNNLIKIIVGQRRCGKSFFMRQIIDGLIEEKIAKPQAILYLNMEYGAFQFIKSYKEIFAVAEAFKNEFPEHKKRYLFIDEVQKIEEWEVAVNSLAQDFTEEWEIFISGSNASLLSGELATLLSGRYLSYTLYPFSYSEYLGIRALSPSMDSFSDYMQHGGMPECFKLPDSDAKQHYISNLRDSIVLRDIVKRYQVRDVRLLDQLIELIIDSVGGLFSISKLVRTLASSSIKTNSITIGNYVEYLKDVFFIHEVPKYDVAGKKIITGERKLYLNDSSFRFYSNFLRDGAPGKYLENAVFMQLLRKGYSVQIGSITGKEIDFVAKKNDELLYIQVAYLLTGEDVIRREFGNLELIKNNYKKIVISLDPLSFGNRNGIEHFRAWEWFI